jgi:hypothetical protein
VACRWWWSMRPACASSSARRCAGRADMRLCAGPVRGHRIAAKPHGRQAAQRCVGRHLAVLELRNSGSHCLPTAAGAIG